ncbi:hypothetical protein AX768_12580 [Burkholderia sp. PAMC 28687]|uniref:DUF3318 domain-containing protein n=1 Tax=Caballeronia sordidicola TaxID=196367 RepID=A0A242N938_CABSO|nr:MULTISPECIES: DUF3318 domain-containing protein [Burkholderiaceae]AMM14807.1 hypothetical protein AX768_12580 [Burkholderia sp. PAMC 28687]OTP80151.1 hypothetical protein PAMC26510_03365 [Caballeronia sordidicola]
MSQTDDTFKAQKRANAHKLSTPHMRALRKELLIARADVERMELAQASADLRHKVKHFSVLNMIMPGRGKRGRNSGVGGFMNRMTGGAGGGRLSGLGSLFNAGNLSLLLKQYPVVGSLASLILAKPVRTRLLASAKPLLKWGGLGLVGWEAYRVWQQMKSTPAATAPVDPVVHPDA